ncbi:TonB-dependent receptor [Alteraurantiacibacter buctensis]|uniref:TonB-dependent receptor n=1 Tax=Alteraurantiacibacter buctensis TaxID=1503981 RepID=A0A844YTG5_9SPHN|nr:TonB-dependent receptor [Alteraurantiacibacter buctensis]MXO70161.1 TonB-dependent receptor [Alteraurantiacibacter buctensis]
MKSVLLASAALLSAVPAIAQNDGFYMDPVVFPEGSTEATADDAADTIVVLGSGLGTTAGTPAYSTVVIDREQIENSTTGRLEEVLGNVAGFQQFRRSDSRSSNPTAQGATLRALGGNAASRALVLLDGVPMVDPFFGHVPYSAIAPERLGAIRVTRGGGSGPFGAGALAGTIELESANAATLGLVQASAMVNDREETQLSASLSPEIGNGFATISGRWERGQGFWTTPQSQRVPASVRASYDSWSTGARLVQRLGGLEVQVRGLAFEDHRTLRFAGADNSMEGQDLSLRVVSRGPWQVDALAYAQWRNFTNVVISSTRFTRTLDQKDTPAQGQGAKFEVRPPLGDDVTLRLGADWRRGRGNLFEDAYNAVTLALTENRFAGGTNTNTGVFADGDVELGRLTLTGGVRADRYTINNGYYRANNAAGTITRNDQFADRSGWEATWRAGALYRAGEVITLRAAAYTGIRLPTLNELYRPFAVFPVTTQANQDLTPERLRGYEAGIDITANDELRLGITVFDNRVRDAIANVTVGTNLRKRFNVDAIDARGVEATGSINSGPFSLDASLAITRARVRDNGVGAALAGLTPAQTPRFSASTSVSYRLTGGPQVGASLRHVSRQFEDDLETDFLKAATTVDLFASMPLFSRLTAEARVENLLDEEIVTRNQAGSVDLGTPQTLWVGLRYGF